MPLLGLDLEVSSGLDGLSLALPGDPWLGVSGEGDLDDSVLTLVEEGRVAETRRHVQTSRGLDFKLSLRKKRKQQSF